MNGRAVLVGENLKLDMTRLAQIAFQQNGVVAESGARFTLRGFERFAERRGRLDDAHSAAAAPCAGFDEQREADAFGLLLQPLPGV